MRWDWSIRIFSYISSFLIFFFHSSTSIKYNEYIRSFFYSSIFILFHFFFALLCFSFSVWKWAFWFVLLLVKELVFRFEGQVNEILIKMKKRVRRQEKWSAGCMRVWRANGFSKEVKYGYAYSVFREHVFGRHCLEWSPFIQKFLWYLLLIEGTIFFWKCFKILAFIYRFDLFPIK